MKNSTKCILTVTAATIAGMFAYNKFVEKTATRNGLLSEDEGSFFDWKQGYVFYTKTGSGNPLLLVHDINSASSSEEWSKIIKRLAKNNTVYTIDLLGCGRSEKPAIQYTNYLYVQLISAFINNVVKEPVDVVATNLAASSIIMAEALDKKLFKNIIFINPVSLEKMTEIPNKIRKFKQNILCTPLIGEFLYNIMMTPIKIDIRFRTRYFAKSELINTKIEDTYYESAHYDKSNGRYLYSSILSNFININIKNALKTTDKKIKIIGSRNISDNLLTLDNYHKTNSNVEITHISNASLYPQLEIPEKIANLIKSML